MEKFCHPVTNTIYDRLDDPNAPQFKEEYLPTPEEIKQCIPNQCGWISGMEDSALNGGIYLSAMVNRWKIRGKKEDAKDARRIFKGLKLLGTISSKPGFISRGVLPDLKSHYINSSVDQYTTYVYGMWRYFHSGIASNEEKEDIIKIFINISSMIEKDNFEILTETGEHGWYGDIGIVRPDRSTRLLEMFLATYDVTKDRYWRDLYLKKAMEDNQARLLDISNHLDMTWVPYSLQQTQVSLRLLFEIEDDYKIKSIYQHDLNTIASSIQKVLFHYQEFDPEKIKVNPNMDADWRFDYERKDLYYHDPDNFIHACFVLNTKGEEIKLPSKNRTSSTSFRGNRFDRKEVSGLCDSFWARRPFLLHEQRTVREPFEALHCIVLSEDNKLKRKVSKIFPEMLNKIDFSLCRMAHSLCYIEECYYLLKKEGFI